VEGYIPFRDVVSNLHKHLIRIKETILKKADVTGIPENDKKMYDDYLNEQKMKYNES
jgi:hypothetical protein